MTFARSLIIYKSSIRAIKLETDNLGIWKLFWMSSTILFLYFSKAEYLKKKLLKTKRTTFPFKNASRSKSFISSLRFALKFSGIFFQLQQTFHSTLNDWKISENPFILFFTLLYFAILSEQRKLERTLAESQ